MLVELQDYLVGSKPLILGIGNRANGDDGVGSYLIKRLQGKLTIPVVDAGSIPEKSLVSVESSGADLVLIVDAADFGGNPGEISMIELDQIKGAGVSTHTANLSLLFNIIPKRKRPRGLLIAVQPGCVSGKMLSVDVRNALDGLEHVFLELFGKPE